MNAKIEIIFHCKYKPNIRMNFETEEDFTAWYQLNAVKCGVVRTYQRIDDKWELI